MEQWKTIEDYPNYMISNMGRVKSLNYNRTGKEKIIKNILYNNSYYYVSLCDNNICKNYSIHRLVATHFLPNPNNYSVVNHKDENKTNNKVENLEWCTTEYNNNYGTHNEKIGSSNLIPILQFTKDGELVRKWDGAADIERELGISSTNISNNLKGRSKSAGGYKWKYYYKGIWLKKHIPYKQKRW